ncbi:hypothetical protein OG785_08645 [Streptomyces sp. NBC_00006]|uniref:hypothetical protein n=1 Tax=Streptomyces sp. NBC_00006 TaxID=2975619 RepID=UPI00224E1933|nr:hypothetical protein [Streptomyces sp. NBC_00006]MCX5530625.1 hypothetical protein [Streptomyces sp. NBC_00006]
MAQGKRGGNGRRVRPFREVAAPFVVTPPVGCRIRTRLRLSARDETVLRAVGEHLGKLVGADLAARVRLGDVPAADNRRAQRKKTLTALSSSRWAGTITCTSEDQYNLARRALSDTIGSLRRAIRAIESRLAIPAGTVQRQGQRVVRGYADQDERHSKQQRLQILQGRLRNALRERKSGRVRITRGGRQLLNSRHHLYATADGTKPSPQQAWQAEVDAWQRKWADRRMFLTAYGEAGAPFGNYTISIDPADGTVALVLPEPLRARFANAPRGRYVLDARAVFTHRGQGWADRVMARGSVRYDIAHHTGRGRWYLDASWATVKKGHKAPVPMVEVLRQHPVVAVDVNADHLAAWLLDVHGNPVGRPRTLPLELSGLPSATRDARLRAAVTQLLDLARLHGCAALVIENLNFSDARATGRENLGRGKRGKSFRRTVAGIPTAQFRDRLSGMAHHVGLSVIAVDPAYTSRWGAQHWLKPLKDTTQTSDSTPVSGHHAAAVVVGRRGLGFPARRRRNGARQTPTRRTAPSRARRVGAVRPEDRTGPAVPVPPSHRTRPRTERTAPARTSRSTTRSPGPVTHQTRAAPTGKHPPKGPNTVRGPSTPGRQPIPPGMPDTANLGRPT